MSVQRASSSSSVEEPWLPALLAGAFVLIGHVLLVRAAGTDVPFHDAWDVEGRWLYPSLVSQSRDLRAVFAAHNEHRILWTHLLDFLLFIGNGKKWDPLVQLYANAALHAVVATLLARGLSRGPGRFSRTVLAATTALLLLPLAGWHNALWGFQSQVYFAAFFAIAAIGWWTRPDTVRRWRLGGGGLLALAAFVAMGPGAIVAGALLVLSVLQLRKGERSVAPLAVASALLVVAWILRPGATVHADLAARSPSELAGVFFRLTAWPHPEQPWAAVVINLPLLAAVVRRATGALDAKADFAIGVGVFALGVAAATAWSRGGGEEIAAGVPSRYVDFLVLVPLANFACLIALLPAIRRAPRTVVCAWGVFVLVGWLGVSAEALRRVIIPRSRDADAPIRLLQRYQATRDAGVFLNQPRLLVPHPNLSSVDAVLDDPLMLGALPPSLQPDQSMGSLSRAARWIHREERVTPDSSSGEK